MMLMVTSKSVHCQDPKSSLSTLPYTARCSEYTAILFNLVAKKKKASN